MIAMNIDIGYINSPLVYSSTISAPTYISAIAPNTANLYNIIHFPTSLTAQNENTTLEMKYNKLKEIIYKLTITDQNYNSNLAQNIETAQLVIDALHKSKITPPEVCVAEDGEIEFDWVDNNKEAIISISRKNRYTYLLKQPSGKYLSGAENIGIEKILASAFINYLSV